MAQANDQQMQTYANDRIRPRAEQFRALINAINDDKLAIDEVYDRAANGAVWTDNRNDGPPKLLTKNDILVYNTFITLLLKCLAGTATAQDIANLSSNYPTFQGACVRAV